MLTRDEEDEYCDEATSKYLSKLSGMCSKLPHSISAHLKLQAWQLSKTQERYQGCRSCFMPPNLPHEEKLIPSEICRRCGQKNAKKIGIVSKIKKVEEKVEMKPAKPEPTKKTPAKPVNSKKNSFENRQMLLSASTPKTSTPAAPLLLQSKKKSKTKPKIVLETNDEPDFLAKLFGIGK
ncbi:unnamed protein product [Caenorhabditis angaria]|uniref:Uncharacterized protein n=1 Tax=Caenorhabditis angaria TaxID=860376 RepID=A0A9P1IZ49_9PELO|nr:unnamed protein product [Caenorhabditis angaria]